MALMTGAAALTMAKSIGTRLGWRGAIAIGLVVSHLGLYTAGKWKERAACDRKFAAATEAAVKQARERDLAAVQESQRVIDETAKQLEDERAQHRESEERYAALLAKQIEDRQAGGDGTSPEQPDGPHAGCDWDDDGFSRL